MGKAKSKTNVLARLEAKKAQRLCRYCGKPVSATMVMVNGRRKMVRGCCGKETRARA